MNLSCRTLPTAAALGALARMLCVVPVLAWSGVLAAAAGTSLPDTDALLVKPPRDAKEQKRLFDEWRRGPVRYLMTNTEHRRAKSLDDPAQQLEFIRFFWNRRDPDRTTPLNEARAVFWQRVAEANRQFSMPGAPGWRTDRGKIFILLGPPNDIEKREDFDTESMTRSGRGLLRWHYTGLERAATRAQTIIAFARDADEDWHLVTDERLVSPYLNMDAKLGDQFGGPILRQLQTRLFDQIPWGQGNLGVAMDLGRLQETPTERELLKAVVEAEGFLGSIDAATAVHTVAAADGRRFLAVTIGVRHSDISPTWDGTALSLAQRFTVSAQLQRGDGTRLDFGDDAFRVEPTPALADPWLRFQALAPLPDDVAAGRWDISGVLLDRRGGGAATLRRSIEVPAAPRGAPSLTGPLLADRLETSPDMVAPGSVPFRVGETILLPRMLPQVGAKDPFALFLALEPPPGASDPVVLTWRWERTAPGAAGPETWGRSGRLDNARGPRAWQLPAGSLPPGRYRVTFEASCGTGSVTRSLEFERTP